MKKVTKYELAEEYYKQYVEGVPLTQDEVIDAYVEAYTIAEEKVKKLTKIINQERVKELEAQIKILQSLL